MIWCCEGEVRDCCLKSYWVIYFSNVLHYALVFFYNLIQYRVNATSRHNKNRSQMLLDETTTV